MILNRFRGRALAPLSSRSLRSLLQSPSESNRTRGFKLQAVAEASASSQRTRPPPKREDIILQSDPANNVSGRQKNNPHYQAAMPSTSSSSSTVADYIFDKIGTNLHHQPDHPIGIIKQAIYSYFDSRHPGKFKKLDDLYPVGESQSPCPSLKSFSSPPEVLLNPN